MSLQEDASDRTDDAGPAEASTLEMFLGYNLKRAFNAIHVNLAMTLRQFDLRMVTYSALTVILENSGLRQAELALALRIDRGNAVAIVDELERRKLIIRGQHPDDRRSYALHITDLGRELCERAIEADRECEARILKGVGEDRVRQIFADLRAIEQAAYDVLESRSDSPKS